MNARFSRPGLLAVAVLMAAAALVSAQAPAGGPPPPAGGQPAAQTPPPPPKNLQVLPKDIARPELIATMRGFEKALGVQCVFCHVAEGRGGRNDYAADEKDNKKKARVMLRMVAHVNEMLATELGEPASELVKVECATCHRGSEVPKLEAAPAAASPEAPRPQAP